jgi:hypothetical protein
MVSGILIDDALIGLNNFTRNGVIKEKFVRAGVMHFEKMLSDDKSPEYLLFSKIYVNKNDSEIISIIKGFKQTFESILSSEGLSETQKRNLPLLKEYLNKAGKYTFRESSKEELFFPV